ncbi:hypothetical protein HOC01_04940 [archaeon]|jgi:hypothetical protein|nr:hypothetical protein [archaeon]MBT6698314.1 hypothetical protein [archaeon]
MSLELHIDALTYTPQGSRTGRVSYDAEDVHSTLSIRDPARSKFSGITETALWRKDIGNTYFTSIASFTDGKLDAVAYSYFGDFLEFGTNGSDTWIRCYDQEIEVSPESISFVLDYLRTTEFSIPKKALESVMADFFGLLPDRLVYQA